VATDPSPDIRHPKLASSLERVFHFWQRALQSEREEPDTMAFGMLLAATSVLHPLQPQAAEQKYLWNVTVGDSFKTFEVMVHPDWCVLRSGH
tara:strand:- start:131 stop:406 length:276 start_codon:yes stop_codon:yes gene_type:complete